MRLILGSLAIAGWLLAVHAADAANTIDNHASIAQPPQVGDELLLWRAGTTGKATLTQVFGLAGIGGDCSGTGGPVVSVVCSLAASKITSGTLAAARLPAPTASTLGGVESIAPASHQWVTSISTAGIPSLAQPSIADLSDGSHAMAGADVGAAVRNGAAPASVSGCGTGATMGVGSTDYSGTVNVGTGTVTACTVAFAASHNPRLRCWIEPSSGVAVATASTVTNTAIVATFSASLGAGTFDYGCQ